MSIHWIIGLFWWSSIWFCLFTLPPISFYLITTTFASQLTITITASACPAYFIRLHPCDAAPFLSFFDFTYDAFSLFLFTPFSFTFSPEQLIFLYIKMNQLHDFSFSHFFTEKNKAKRTFAAKRFTSLDNNRNKGLKITMQNKQDPF